MIEELQLHREEIIKKHYKNSEYYYNIRDNNSFVIFVIGSITLLVSYSATSYALSSGSSSFSIIGIILLLISSVLLFISNSILDRHILISNILKNRFGKDQHIKYLKNKYGDITSDNLIALSTLLKEKANKKRKQFAVNFSFFTVLIPFVLAFINLQENFKMQWLIISLVSLFLFFIFIRIVAKKIEIVINKEANELEELAELLQEASIFMNSTIKMESDLEELKSQVFRNSRFSTLNLFNFIKHYIFFKRTKITDNQTKSG